MFPSVVPVIVVEEVDTHSTIKHEDKAGSFAHIHNCMLVRESSRCGRRRVSALAERRVGLKNVELKMFRFSRPCGSPRRPHSRSAWAIISAAHMIHAPRFLTSRVSGRV